MNITLIGINHDDSFAIYKNDGTYYELSYPFKPSSSKQITKANPQKFFSVNYINKSYKSLEKMVEFITNSYNERLAMEEEEAGKNLDDDFVKFAPSERVMSVMEKLHSRICEAKKYQLGIDEFRKIICSLPDGSPKELNIFANTSIETFTRLHKKSQEKKNLSVSRRKQLKLKIENHGVH